MATTDLGIPLVDLDTDQPNGAGQMNAIAAAVDALLQARPLPAAWHLTGHAIMTGLSSGTNLVGGPWTTAYHVGDITYGSGIFTAARDGLYVWACSFLATASSSSSVFEVGVVVNGSAPANTDGNVAVTMNPTNHNGIAGGPIALAANDQVQLNIFVDAVVTGLTVTPHTFSLYMVG